MSHASPRSLRVKADALTRPDVIWRDVAGEQSARLDKPASQQQPVLAGGSDLAQLIAEVDAHLVAMRKIAG